MPERKYAHLKGIWLTWPSIHTHHAVRYNVENKNIDNNDNNDNIEQTFKSHFCERVRLVVFPTEEKNNNIF